MGNRVDQSEVDRKQRDKRDKAPEAMLGHLSRQLSDLERSPETAGTTLSGDNLPHARERLHRHVPGVPNTIHDGTHGANGA